MSFFAVAKIATLCAVAVGVPSVCRAKMPDGMQWGVTFGFYATNGYFGSVEAKAEIDAIARAGATWVTVVPTVWQDACSSSFQYKDFALTRTTSNSWTPLTSSTPKA